MTTKSDGPVALITGVSRSTGLGMETTRQLGRKGDTVVVTARDLG
jgi:NAD(P)-dependent dehydrogenase (short-subunit alcohol dehydrogenase family)